MNYENTHTRKAQFYFVRGVMVQQGSQTKFVCKEAKQ